MADDDWKEGAFGSPPAGHNRPPPDEPLAFAMARSMVREVQDATANLPKITSQEQADSMATLLRGVQMSFNNLDRHRSDRVNPLNLRVKAINDEYRPLKDTLERIETQLKALIRGWLMGLAVAGEAKVAEAKAEAERLAKVAADAQQEAARQAEKAREGDATDGVPRPHEANLEASQATLEARKAEARAAALEKATPKAGGGGSRAVGLVTKEVLLVRSKTDLMRCLNELVKVSETYKLLVEQAISLARRYRQLKGKLPTGITRREQKQ